MWTAFVARNWNKPTSSKKTDKTVIEKKRINIFKGLTGEEEVNSCQISPNKEGFADKTIIAPIKATIQ